MKLEHQLKLWEIPYKLKTIEFIALSISATVSTFGLYTILSPLIAEKYQLTLILFSFIGFFMLIDRLRRGALAAFLNSQLTQLVESHMQGKFQLNGGLEASVTPTKTKWFAGLLGGVFTFVILFADIFGGYSIYEVGKKHLIEYEISTNQSYQKEIIEEKSGKTALEDFNEKISSWNANRAEELALWRSDELANKKSYAKNKKIAYSSCDRVWSLARSFYTKNAECKAKWDKANPYRSIAKPAELMKPVLVASENEKEVVVIGSSINQAIARAEQWAEPFAKGFFMLYVVLSLILNGLVLKSMYLAFTETERDINTDPSLYNTAYQHYEIVRRAERHGISENKQKEETETMNVRVKLSSKITDLTIKGEAKKAAIKLKQHQIIEEGGFKDIIKRLREKNVDPKDYDEFYEYFNNVNDEPVSQPIPKKIEQKEEDLQVAAKHSEPTVTEQKAPIGFKVGSDNIEHTIPTAAKAPTYKESGYFDDGYDLTVAIVCLYGYGSRKEEGDELLSNPELKKLYDKSPFKRNELNVNQIPTLVKGPLKEAGYIIERKGYRDTVKKDMYTVIKHMELNVYLDEFIDELNSINAENS